MAVNASLKLKSECFTWDERLRTINMDLGAMEAWCLTDLSLRQADLWSIALGRESILFNLFDVSAPQLCITSRDINWAALRCALILSSALPLSHLSRADNGRRAAIFHNEHFRRDRRDRAVLAAQSIAPLISTIDNGLFPILQGTEDKSKGGEKVRVYGLLREIKNGACYVPWAETALLTNAWHNICRRAKSRILPGALNWQTSHTRTHIRIYARACAIRFNLFATTSL